MPRKVAKPTSAEKATALAESLRHLERCCGVLRQQGQQGTPLPQVYTMLEIGDDLLADEGLKALYEYEYERGVALGVSDVFLGIKRAAANGDLKAVEMFFDLTGMQFNKKQDSPSGGTRKLFVEVTSVDE